MLTRPQSAVYKCIIPVKKPLTPSGAMYHSLFREPREGALLRPFPAWPEIDDPYQPCCLPTLPHRPVYFHYRYGGEFDAIARRVEAYWNEVVEREILEQIGAMVKSHEVSLQPWVELGGLPRLNFGIDYYEDFNMKFGNFVERVVEAIVQGVIYGNLNNFLGAPDGDFSDVFSYPHELSHIFAGNLYCGRVLDELSKSTHKTLEILATEESLSRGEIAKLWREFWHTDEQIKCLVRKFEPIEEIFATYMGLRFLPANVRNAVKPTINEELQKRKWDKAYELFSKMCDTYLEEMPHETASFIVDLICRIIEKVDGDDEDLLYKLLKIIDTDAIDELEEVALLEQAGVPAEVFHSIWQTYEDLAETAQSMRNDGSLSDRKQELLLRTYIFRPQVYLLGQFSENYIYTFAPESEHDRVFYESLRQQLSQRCGLVCPGTCSRERRSCGWTEAFQRVYERLPDEYKKYFHRPE